MSKFRVTKAFVFDGVDNSAREIDPSKVEVSEHEIAAIHEADKAEAKYQEMINKLSRGEV